MGIDDATQKSTASQELAAAVYRRRVHDYFGLTYASYQVLPRSILQSMPLEWQERFVALMEEADEIVGDAGIEVPDYTVNARAGKKFIADPYRDYQRGRRNVFTELKDAKQ